MSATARVVAIPGNALVVLLGPSGSGKSTFARERFRATEIVSSDACRLLVSDSETDQMASPQAFMVFEALIRARLSLGRLTVADATNLQPASRERLRRIAAECRAPVVAMILDVPLSLCLQQAAARERFVRPEVIEWHFRLYRRAREAAGREGYDAIHLVQPGTRVAVVLPPSRRLPPPPAVQRDPTAPSAAG